MNPVDEAEVKLIVLKQNHHCIQQIVMHRLKPLVFIFNMSLKTALFPSEMKLAKLIPIFNKGDKCHCK